MDESPGQPRGRRVDDVSIEQFEKKLDNNLYRIWNRLSSGSYMPPAVKRVLIPKADGKQRPLGIPTVGDRVAQMIVKWELEPKVEPMFHPDSYGTSYEQALAVKAAVEARLRSCKLEMHPDKTRIVYCRDGQRRQDYPHIQFDFLGYTFHARDAKGPQGVVFTSFLPAISMKAVKAIVTENRQWKLHRQSDKDLARMLNASIRGWIAYYGRFYPSALQRIFEPLNKRLMRWAQGKYKQLRSSPRRAWQWIRRIAACEPSATGKPDLCRKAMSQ